MNEGVWSGLGSWEKDEEDAREVGIALDLVFRFDIVGDSLGGY